MIGKCRLLLAALAAVGVFESTAAAQEIVLRMPFELKKRVPVSRGRGVESHADVANKFAIDFSPLAVGTPVHASASGVVVFVKQDTEGPTGRWQDNNEVAIRLPDGAVVVYLHLKQNGAAVKEGDSVLAGDLIGWSGHTGNSTRPHLHVDVRAGHRLGRSIPWRFAEPPGVPKKGDSMVSANVPLRPHLAGIVLIEKLYDLCADLNTIEAVAPLVTKLDRKVPATIRREKKIKELPDLWLAYRNRIVGRHENDSAMAMRRVERTQKTDPGAALALAFLVERDFPGLPAALRCKGLLRDASADGRRNARERNRDALRFREAITRAIRAELKGKGKPSRKVRSAYRAAIGKATDEAARARLEAHVAGLRERP